MRLFARILSLLLFLSACKKDQLQWQQVQKIETGTTARFNKLIRVNDSVIMAAGGEKYLNATVLRSHDNGKSWQLIAIPQAGKSIYGISVSSAAGKVFGCGYDGQLISSVDQGLTWQFHQMLNWQFNVGVAFPSPDNGIVISTITQDSGFITHTGMNGQVGVVKRLNIGLNDVKFTSAKVGYICGLGAVLRTIDTGNTWNFTDVKNDNFVSSCFYGASDCWACGYNGSIWHSGDGGLSWQSLRNGNDLTNKTYHLQDIVFTDASTGYAVGEAGTVIYTRDGGNNWSSFPAFTSEDLHGVLAFSGTEILVCGNNGTLYHLYF